VNEEYSLRTHIIQRILEGRLPTFLFSEKEMEWESEECWPSNRVNRKVTLGDPTNRKSGWSR
jgi:hypothetical protein